MSRVLERRTFWLLALFAIAARLALLATTYGTNDAGFMAVWVDLVKHAGVAQSYAHNAMMNHPPLSVALMRIVDSIATTTGIAFVDVFRFFQVLADIVSAIALFHIGRRTSVEHGRALALFLLLSPGAAFISAFHCNTDATMVALICVAASLFSFPLLSGAALALASGIKIVPFLLAPIFVLSMPIRNAIRFAIAFAVVAAAIFLPPMVIAGPIVAKVLFGYRGGLPYEWGVSGVAFALSRIWPSLGVLMTFWQAHGSVFVYAGIASVLVLVWRKQDLLSEKPPAEAGGQTETLNATTPAPHSDPSCGGRLQPAVSDRLLKSNGRLSSTLHASEIMLLVVLALAPGFGVQYTGWIIAFLPFALSWRGAIAMNAVVSAFLFTTYTVWSGGWPWWFADIARPGPYRWLAAVAGYVTWSIVCVALVVAVRRFIATRRSETAG